MIIIIVPMRKRIFLKKKINLKKKKKNQLKNSKKSTKNFNEINSRGIKKINDVKEQVVFFFFFFLFLSPFHFPFPIVIDQVEETVVEIVPAVPLVCTPLVPGRGRQVGPSVGPACDLWPQGYTSHRQVSTSQSQPALRLTPYSAPDYRERNGLPHALAPSSHH